MRTISSKNGIASTVGYEGTVFIIEAGLIVFPHHSYAGFLFSIYIGEYVHNGGIAAVTMKGTDHN